MATNFFFNNFPSTQVTSEQLLMEDLVIESLKMHGMDVYYLPRESRSSIDYLYGEDPMKSYTQAFPVEMYLENVTGMDGEGDFISKFGLEIRDEVSMLVARRRFKYALASMELIRPREGDLLYLPLLQNFFEITKVEHEDNQAMMYTLGRGRDTNVYLFALKLKKFVFSNEKIITGIEEIDAAIRPAYPKTRITLTAGGTGTWDVGNTETVFIGANVATSTMSATAIAYRSSNRALDVILTTGVITSGLTLKGATSNAHWVVTSSDVDSPMDESTVQIDDNKTIETDADAIIDFSESNPFGVL